MYLQFEEILREDITIENAMEVNSWTIGRS